MLIISFHLGINMYKNFYKFLSETIALISKLHSKNSFVTELVIMPVCMCLQTYSGVYHGYFRLRKTSLYISMVIYGFI